MERRESELGKLRPRAHSVHIDNRMRVSITGVLDVESFNDGEVQLITDAGDLRIEGNGLHITRLSLDDGQVVIEGEIIALEYTENSEQRGTLFSRMFR